MALVKPLHYDIRGVLQYAGKRPQVYKVCNEDQIATTKTFNINIILYCAGECTIRMWDVVMFTDECNLIF